MTNLEKKEIYSNLKEINESIERIYIPSCNLEIVKDPKESNFLDEEGKEYFRSCAAQLEKGNENVEFSREIYICKAEEKIVAYYIFEAPTGQGAVIELQRLEDKEEFRYFATDFLATFPGDIIREELSITIVGQTPNNRTVAKHIVYFDMIEAYNMADKLSKVLNKKVDLKDEIKKYNSTCYEIRYSEDDAVLMRNNITEEEVIVPNLFFDRDGLSFEDLKELAEEEYTEKYQEIVTEEEKEEVDKIRKFLSEYPENNTDGGKKIVN